MQTNNIIINVITKDFAFIKDTLDNANINTIAKSLNSITCSLNNYAKSINVIKSKTTEDGINTIFIPYFKPGQFLNEIKKLSETIIIVSGIDTKSDEFQHIQNNAWLVCEKIVVDESHGEVVKNHTDIYVNMFKVAHPRNNRLPSGEVVEKVPIEERYAKFVELANDRLTMKEIAVALGLSVPATYLFRTQYKTQLLNDINVMQNVPAMKFNITR
jgi:hypothetical protein